VRRPPLGAALGLGLLLCLPGAGFARQPGQQSAQQAGQQLERQAEPKPARTPVVTTPHFAIYSDFDANLNDALIAAGLARKGKKPELMRSPAEAACFGKLPASARAAWNGAVDYYQEIISPARWSDRPQYLVRVQIAGFDEELKDPADRQFVDIAQSFRAAAAPAYRACRWAAQDEANRRWLAEIKARLATYEPKIAPRLEQLYRKQWTALPIAVDVVETVDWSGANSILRDPAGGHILISIQNERAAALEILFHEASHLLMGRDAPIRRALDEAAAKTDLHLPGDLWHVVLFYTTGEAVRRILADDGQPAYTPVLYAIFARGTWTEYRQALESNWQPYVDGKRDLPAAAGGLIEAVRKAGAAKVGAEKPQSGRNE
jgi:hypothetical protein